jgi:hypothetical protein
MRVTCSPLSPDGESIPLAADKPLEPLWTRRLQWMCRDKPLDLQVIFAEPLELPEAEPSEPPEGAIARLERAISGTGALLLLRNPAEAFGAERIGYAVGTRLFAIAGEADEACWDAMLSLGQPIYGVRGTVVCEALRPQAASVLSSLAYGQFVCEEGLALRRLDEDRERVAWDAGRADAEAAVVIRGGYEAARLRGATGEWRDRGNEGYVRVTIRSGTDACWTQPRLIMPKAGAKPHS